MSSQQDRSPPARILPIGRIVSVTGSKAIVLLDGGSENGIRALSDRPEMGTLLAIDTANTTVLAIVSALSVPVPAQREGDNEVWIAELGLVGELLKASDGRRPAFNRGVTVYPALGDRVRVALKPELEHRLLRRQARSVRVGSIRQDTPSRQWSGSTSCSASISPSSARPAPASPARRR